MEHAGQHQVLWIRVACSGGRGFFGYGQHVRGAGVVAMGTNKMF